MRMTLVLVVSTEYYECISKYYLVGFHIRDTYRRCSDRIVEILIWLRGGSNSVAPLGSETEA